MSDNLLPCKRLLWVVVANLLLQEHMLAVSFRHRHGSFFCCTTSYSFAWSVHVYFFRRRIPADTRLEMFANSVTTVAVPRADKAVCSQMRFGSGQKDYAARTDSAPQFQQEELFWRKAVSECVPLRENNGQGSLFHVCGARTRRTISAYDVKPTLEH
jgi:hypothetical protein